MQVQRDPLLFYSEPSFAERAGKLYLSPSDRDYWRPSRADSRGRSRCRSCCYLCAGEPLRNLSSDHFKYLGRNSTCLRNHDQPALDNGRLSAAHQRHPPSDSTSRRSDRAVTSRERR
jgi:hypothetical protein